MVNQTLGHAAKGSERVTILLKRGDAFYSQAPTATSSWSAIGFYHQAIKLDLQNFEAFWRLARAHNELSGVIGDKQQRRQIAKQGYDYAIKAIALKPRRVEGHFWAAICIGRYGNDIGVFTAIRQGIREKFLRHLNDAIRLDRSYDGGGPDRIYALYHQSLPWPLRNNKKAIGYFMRSLQYQRQHPVSLYYLAKALRDEDQLDEAKAYLKQCLKADISIGHRTHNQEHQRLCQSLLNSLKH
jgi:tetratricopeptide (TPR) repeat protein